MDLEVWNVLVFLLFWAGSRSEGQLCRLKCWLECLGGEGTGAIKTTPRCPLQQLLVLSLLGALEEGRILATNEMALFTQRKSMSGLGTTLSIDNYQKI
jgi:hypothetical protein